jgi:hypothetical protein
VNGSISEHHRKSTNFIVAAQQLVGNSFRTVQFDKSPFDGKGSIYRNNCSAYQTNCLLSSHVGTRKTTSFIADSYQWCTKGG